MTTPGKALAFPQINHEALAKQIAAHVELADELILHTRTEAMLEDGEARAKALEIEQAAYRRDITTLEGNIEAIQKVIAKMKVVENDVTVELAVTNASNAALRQAGVVLRTRENSGEKE